MMKRPDRVQQATEAQGYRASRVLLCVSASLWPEVGMPTIHSGLQRSMRLAAIAGIVAFLSFPVGPGAPSGSGVVHWLDTLISYTR